MREEPEDEVYRVFVSSTYLDNKARRQAVIEQIRNAGMQEVAMERWSADTRRAQVMCLEEAATAHLYVGILAYRYGWIPDDGDISITEMEYDAADGIEKLMFLVDEREQKADPERDFDTDGRRWLKQDKLDLFKARARKDQAAIPFTDAGLDLLVFRALIDWRERRRKQRSEAIRSQSPPKRATFDAQLADYLDALKDEHGTLTLAGFETKLQVPLDLDELYVPVDIALDSRPTSRGAQWEGIPEEPGDEEFAEQERSLAWAVERLSSPEWNKRRGLVLLGHPGSGKTTQLRRIALSVAREGPGSLGLPADTVPVFLPLRALTDEADLESFLVAELSRLGFDAAFAKELHQRGRMLLLLDGLDEVPSARRIDVKGWVEDAVAGRKHNRAILSCRFAGYRDDNALDARFARLELRPLTDLQVADFVRRWYRVVETSWVLERDASEAARRRARTKARERAEDLIQRLSTGAFRNARVYELAHNPLLLTAICLVDRDRGRLPEQRAELYRECVDALLQHWRERAKRLKVRFDRKEARLVLQRVAWAMHAEENRARASAADLVAVIGPALEEIRRTDVSPEQFLETIRDESGLLTGWSDESYGFLHLGFQEYLTALELRARVFAQAGDPAAFERELQGIAARFGQSWWREVLCLLVSDDEPSLFAPLFRVLVRCEAFAEKREWVDELLEDAARFDPTPFVELVTDPTGGWMKQRAEATRILKARAEAELDRLRLEGGPVVRVRLAKLEADCRRRPLNQGPALERRVTERGGVELVRIPGGSFLMGSPEGEGESDERPQHEVRLSTFFLGVTPITNEQYARFLNAQPGTAAPEYWGDRRFNQPKQPVVGVSWKQARAFCEWVGGNLPTEAQWEYACRAGTTTLWSCGGEERLAEVAWYRENSRGRLHTVGELTANSWGLCDMHGNVREWCADWYGRYGPEAQEDPAGPAAGSLRVIRSGSFWYVADRCRSAYRNRLDPDDRFGGLGFRVAFPAAAGLGGDPGALM